MTQDRTNSHDRDAALRRRYGELSDETTPTGLDERIIAAATRAARPGYIRPLRWMRPLAWAATIVLTVSVILHMADVPGPGDITPPTAGYDAVLDARDADRSERPAEPTETPEPARERRADTRVLEDSGATPAATVPERRERAMATDTPADDTRAKASESFDAAARSLPDADMLRRASELARQQESGSETVPLAAEMALLPAAADRTPETCTEAERHSDETWLACI